MEVVYLGLGALPEQIAQAAVQEDVDVIGISSMEGAHHVKVPQLMEQLRQLGGEVPVVCGGIIPLREAEELKRIGVREVFPPGSALKDIIAAFQKYAGGRRVKGGK